jgi:protein SCO1
MTTPPAGPPERPAFSLVDHHANPVTEADFRGRWMLVFFGFTHCRQVCPRALGRISEALELLGEHAAGIQPLYVTVDPARDSPEVMRAFLEGDHPRFTGLTGSAEQAEAARREFRVFARRRADPDDPDGYAVPHTALTYLLDDTGRYRVHFTDTRTAAQLAEAIRETRAGVPG